MAIDFDGTNDAYTADISIFGVPLLPVFAQGFFNYDGQIGTKTLLYFSNAGAANTLILSKSGTTLSWTIFDGSSSFSVTASISAATWTGFQVYMETTGTDEIGLRVWTTSAPGAFSTASGLPHTDLTVLNVGYDGSTNFFNGRMAELFVTMYSEDFSSQWTAVTDSLARLGTPLGILPPLHQDIVIDNSVSTIGLYWPMMTSSVATPVAAGNQTDLFNSDLLTAVDSPSSHPSHPRIYRSGGKKVTIN